MERASSVDALHRQPDGVTLAVRSYGEGKRGVLVLPDVGEGMLDWDPVARTLARDGIAVHALELRGHPLSQGMWSLHAYRVDLAYWVAHLRERHGELYVVASGLSASTMLEYDDQAHGMRDRPPVPDGMVLVSPVFEGKELLLRLGSIRLDREARRNAERDLSSYRLPPVRIQSPAAVFVPMDPLADPLKRVFGNVTLRRAKWLHRMRADDASRAERAHHATEIGSALRSVMDAERPIRFPTY